MGSHKEHKGNKEERAMDGKEEKAAERLTGKERLLRGGKVFLWTFVVVVVLFTLSADVVPERDVLAWRVAWGGMVGATVALVAGLVVMAFPVRRWWHWVFAVVVGVLALGAL